MTSAPDAKGPRHLTRHNRNEPFFYEHVVTVCADKSRAHLTKPAAFERPHSHLLLKGGALDTDDRKYVTYSSDGMFEIAFPVTRTGYSLTPTWMQNVYLQNSRPIRADVQEVSMVNTPEW